MQPNKTRLECSHRAIVRSLDCLFIRLKEKCPNRGRKDQAQVQPAQFRKTGSSDLQKTGFSHPNQGKAPHKTSLLLIAKQICHASHRGYLCLCSPSVLISAPFYVLPLREVFFEPVMNRHVFFGINWIFLNNFTSVYRGIFGFFKNFQNPLVLWVLPDFP